jgi:hypothetical protein
MLSGLVVRGEGGKGLGKEESGKGEGGMGNRVTLAGTTCNSWIAFPFTRSPFPPSS